MPSHPGKAERSPPQPEKFPDAHSLGLERGQVEHQGKGQCGNSRTRRGQSLSLIHISEPTRLQLIS